MTNDNNKYIAITKIFKEFFSRKCGLRLYEGKVNLYGETGLTITFYEKKIVRGNMKIGNTVERKKKGEKRADNIGRTKRNIYMLARANFNAKNTKFITLTFRNETKGISECYGDFKNFIKRLKYKHDLKKYLGVAELTKAGRVHYHLMAEMPYLSNEKLSDIWTHGFVKITAIEHVDNLGAYIVKYISKSVCTLSKLGQKAYYRSANLVFPREVEIKNIPDDIGNELTKILLKEKCRSKFYVVANGNYATSVDVNPSRMSQEGYSRVLKLLSMARYGLRKN